MVALAVALEVRLLGGLAAAQALRLLGAKESPADSGMSVELVPACTQADLIRCIFGNPFRPIVTDPKKAVVIAADGGLTTRPRHRIVDIREWLTWNDGTILKLAQAIYAERTFDRLPILADALEDAGCTIADMLTHARSAGPHCRGCWLVDLLLGKE